MHQPSRRQLRLRLASRFAAVLIAIGPVPEAQCLAQPAQADEASVKAAFVYNFGKFTEWPAETWAQAAKLRVCIVGPGTATAQAVAALDKKPPVQGKELTVVQTPRRDEAGSCHVLLLTEQGKAVDEWLKAVQDLPVLTVSDAPEFVDRGGVLGLVIEGDRVRFEANLDAAQRARLKLSSQLLKLARAVKGAPGAKP